jgi:ribosome recycling factor
MRHDWIFDVLTDLRSYALQNELRDLAEQVEIALRTARRDVAAAHRAEAEDDAWDDDLLDDDPPPPRLRH